MLTEIEEFPDNSHALLANLHYVSEAQTINPNNFIEKINILY